MVNEKQFVEAINTVKSIHEFYSSMYNYLVIDNFPTGEDKIIDLLIVDMNLNVDKVFGDTISWWCYDTNFGAKADEYKIYKYGKEFSLYTPEDLYYFLVNFELN